MFTVISDLNYSDTKKLIGSANNISKIFSIDKHTMKSCVGCFNCWIKTPGICIFNDVSREINKSIIKNDSLLIITKLTYGCYSPYIKNALDRVIPTILPFFKKINNELHHKPRYEKYPEIIAIGYGENITLKETETFSKLVKANSLNFQTSKYQSYVAKDIVTLENTISKILGGDSFE